MHLNAMFDGVRVTTDMNAFDNAFFNIITVTTILRLRQ